MDSTIDLFLILWGTSILFSLVAVPVYNPFNSVQISPFSTYSQTHNFYVLLLIVILTYVMLYLIVSLIFIFLMTSDVIYLLMVHGAICMSWVVVSLELKTKTKNKTTTFLR